MPAQTSVLASPHVSSVLPLPAQSPPLPVLAIESPPVPVDSPPVPVDSPHTSPVESAESPHVLPLPVQSHQHQFLTSTPVSLRTATVPTLGVTVLDCRKLLLRLQPDDQLEVLSRLFSEYTCRQCPNSLRVSTEFLSIMLRGMRHLKECGRTNVI